MVVFTGAVSAVDGAAAEDGTGRGEAAGGRATGNEAARVAKADASALRRASFAARGSAFLRISLSMRRCRSSALWRRSSLAKAAACRRCRAHASAAALAWATVSALPLGRSINVGARLGLQAEVLRSVLVQTSTVLASNADCSLTFMARSSSASSRVVESARGPTYFHSYNSKFAPGRFSDPSRQNKTYRSPLQT